MPNASLRKFAIIPLTFVLLFLFFGHSSVFAFTEKFSNTGFETDLTGWPQGDANWWLSGGVSASNAVAVYHPIIASNLASSYINIANPGTYNATPGVAPTFSTGTGWTFNGSTQYLTTGVVPGNGWSGIVRYSDWLPNDAFPVLFGGHMDISPFWGIQSSAHFIFYSNQSYIGVYGMAPPDGVLAFGGQRGYRNGVAEGLPIAETGGSYNSVYIGNGNPLNGWCTYFAGNIQALAIYNTALTANQVLAITNSMNTLGVINRDTSIKYAGSGSAKIVAINNYNVIQSVNVGDTDNYNLTAYVYTDGSAVTSSDAELYYNGSTITTSYTSVGSNWYKLAGVVTGANASRDYGIQIKAGKTVYLDNLSLNLVDSIDPSISLTALTPDPGSNTTPGFAGTATDVSGTVSAVQYQVDSTTGSWTACTAVDGAFDEALEAFTCTVTAALSTNADHTMYVRATDNASNTTTAGSEASDTFNVSGLAVTEPEVTPNLAPSGVSDPNNSGTAVLGAKTVTSSDEVSVNWDRPANTSNIHEYVVHYREIGSSTWKTESAGPDADSISWDPGEGNWEWYLEIVYTDGSTSETSTYKFEVDQTAPEDGTLTIDENSVTPGATLLLAYGSPLIFNFGNTEWDTVIEIWNWDKTIHYTTMVCGSGVCDHGDILTGPLTLVIYTVDEAGNESDRREIKVSPFGVTASLVPATTNTTPAVQGVTTGQAITQPASPTSNQIAPGIVRGAVDIDTSLNPSAIKNPGIVNGAVDVAPAPEPTPPPKKLNIIQRIWNSVFH